MRACVCGGQECEAEERRQNPEKYKALRVEAEQAARAEKARRDRAAPRGGRQREGEPADDEPAAAAAYDEDAVLPEFSLAGGQGRVCAAS